MKSATHSVGTAEQRRILLVEDEEDIRSLIAMHLRRVGYSVDEVSDGEQALSRFQAGRFDLLILDWMLPGLSGLDIARRVRSGDHQPSVPVLMVTARVEPADIVMGLEAGADDYVTKPFELPVLIARVRALLRRSEISESEESRDVGDLKIIPDRYEVFCRAEPLSLTRYEFKLLLNLVKNQGRVLTREQLIQSVQGEGVSVVDRAIDTHVFGLRKKLGACAGLIETVRGVGYRIWTGVQP